MTSHRARPEDDMLRNLVIPFYSSMGFEVYSTSARVWAKGVTPGIADLYVVGRRQRLAFWHEAKVPRHHTRLSRQSLEQRKFQELMVHVQIPYVLGDLESAYDFVAWLTLGVRVGVGFRRFVDGSSTVPAALHGWNITELALKQNEIWGWRPKRSPGEPGVVISKSPAMRIDMLAKPKGGVSP